MAAAATELRGVGSIVSTVNAAAAVPTTALWPAAADEVSAAIAALFSSHAQQYQSLSVQVAAYHDQFVRALAAGGASYSLAEAASASPLEQLLDLINLPSQTLLGRPLIGDGADGTASAPNGGAGGLLYGNGGNGYDNSASAGLPAVPADLPDWSVTVASVVPVGHSRREAQAGPAAAVRQRRVQWGRWTGCSGRPGGWRRDAVTGRKRWRRWARRRGNARRIRRHRRRRQCGTVRARRFRWERRDGRRWCRG
ncbi:PE family protein [Mycobacterium ulcerans str. Harvey]|uniref:PE family protein n=1 Tax=Mycobacterium ulcerans str. Harvey TaxID=1299332 RepID=A0ABN0QYK1_MYCUL|nr:PE family protein [Mycobacterium ulcerans str. Harvey]